MQFFSFCCYFLFRHGAQSLTISKFIPDIVNLLSDPTATVRDTAINTLVDLYKHVGDKLRIDLQRRNLVPQAKWPALAARFDEAKSRGELLLTASKSIDCKFSLSKIYYKLIHTAYFIVSDEVDKAVMAKPIVPVKKPSLGSAIKQRSISTPSSANTGKCIFNKH